MSLPETTPRSRVWTPGRFSMGVFSRVTNLFDATPPRPVADHDYLGITFTTGALPTRTATCAICREDIKANDNTIMHRYQPSRFDSPDMTADDLGIDKWCDNAFHEDCFKEYCAATQKGCPAIKCPYCRGKMPWRVMFSQSYSRGEFPWGGKIPVRARTQESSEASEPASTSRTSPPAMPPTTHQSETPSISALLPGILELYTGEPTPYYPPPPMFYPATSSPPQSADSTRTSEATPSSPIDEGSYSPSADQDSIFYDRPTLPRSESLRLVPEDIDDESARALLDNFFVGRPSATGPARRRGDNFTTNFMLDEVPPSAPTREQRPQSSPIFMSIHVEYRNSHREDMTFDTTGMTPERIRARMEIARHSRSGSYTISQPGNEADTLSYSDHLRMVELCDWANWALIRQRKLIFGEDQEVVRGEDGALRMQRRRQTEAQEAPEDEDEDGEDADDEREDDAGCGEGGHQEANGDEDDMDEPLGGQAREAMEIIRHDLRSLESIDRLRASLQGTIQAPDEVARGARPREAMETIGDDQRSLERHDRLLARVQGLLQPLDEEARVLRARESEARDV